MHVKRIALITLGILLILLGGFFLVSKPSDARAWIVEQSRTATGTISDESVTITNVRDWTYGTSSPLTTEWRTVTVDPREITRVWFLLEPFSEIKEIGHTFLSFEFEDGTVLSFSVEARREQGEEYSALKGQFNAYELSYQWGFERDFVTRRLLYLDHPLRLYPLELTPEARSALFLTLVTETNVLAENPRFYSTLLHNCTNTLARIVNRHYPSSLPWDKSWYLTGLSDEYLMNEGYIVVDESVNAAQAAADLTPHREAVRSFSETNPKAFSQQLRALLAPNTL